MLVCATIIIVIITNSSSSSSSIITTTDNDNITITITIHEQLVWLVLSLLCLGHRRKGTPGIGHAYQVCDVGH